METNSLKLVLGSHPSTLLAFALLPQRLCNSAGRLNAGDVSTYFS